jgi:hypothetical protein
LIYLHFYSTFKSLGRVVRTLFYAIARRFFRLFDASVHTERTRVATLTRLKSGSWRVQVRRKGKYVNETFLRRKDAEEWGIDIERRIDRQEPTTTRQSRDVQLFGDLVALHRQDLGEVGKDIGRSKTASLIFLDERLGHLRLPELDRERLIKFGKERALDGAGPVTVGIDLGYIKTILSHAAAVHGVVVSTEPIDLARIALGHLGLVGKGDERDRRPTQDELDGIISALEANNKFQLVVSSDLPSQRRCGKTKLQDKDWKMLRRYTHLKPEALHSIRSMRVA